MSISNICTTLMGDRTSYFSRLDDKIGPGQILDEMVKRNIRLVNVHADLSRPLQCVNIEDWTIPANTPLLSKSDPPRDPYPFPYSFKSRLPCAGPDYTIYVAQSDSVHVFDESKTLLRSYKTEFTETGRTCVTYDGHIFVTEQSGGKMLLLDPQGKTVARGDAKCDTIRNIAWDPSSNTFAVDKGSYAVDIFKYNKETNSIDFVRQLLNARDNFQILSFTYDSSGKLIVCSASETALEPVAIYSPDGTLIQRLTNGGQAAIVDKDGKIVIWELSAEKVASDIRFKFSKWDN